MRTFLTIALMLAVGAAPALTCDADCREPEVAAGHDGDGCERVRSVAPSVEPGRAAAESRRPFVHVADYMPVAALVAGTSGRRRAGDVRLPPPPAVVFEVLRI